MQKLTRQDLYSLEEYAQKRKDFRAQVIAHKKNRNVAIGPNASLYFEDRLTMQYQIQEMLRVERIFEAEGIEEELSAYNPLIPTGTDWRATFMIEVPDEDERHMRLAEWLGIEDRVWVQVDMLDRVYALADEDMERANEEKTSAVHFMRFALPADMITALHQGGDLAMGIDHPKYRHEVKPCSPPVRASLLADLD